MKVSGAIFVALLLTAGTTAAQEFSVYKWVDEDGVPHYTDRPPNAAEVQATGIRSRRTNPNAVMARVEQQNKSYAELNKSGEEDEQQATDAAAERRQTQQERKQNCQKARERAETYDTAHRLYRPLPDGGREYLTADELTEARTAANEAVDTWCN